MLRISGITPFTMIDFPNALSAVLFCQGCSWRCGYCHNAHLQPFTKGLISWEAVLHFLEERKGFLDAVVFSGGEPTQQSDLSQAMTEIKEMGYKIGLHTAGVYPQGLRNVLHLLDWVGMDIKAPFSKYPQVTQIKESGEKAKKCASMIIRSNVAYEFRTTVHPHLLSKDDLVQLTKELAHMGATTYVIQPVCIQGQKDETFVHHPIFSSSFLDSIGRQFAHFSVR